MGARPWRSSEVFIRKRWLGARHRGLVQGRRAEIYAKEFYVYEITNVPVLQTNAPFFCCCTITVHDQTADSSLSAATPPKPDEPKIRDIAWRSSLRLLFRDSGVLSVGIGAFIISLGALIATFIDAPKKFSPHPNYDSQLTALDKTKDAIQSLIGFIDDQKKQIQLSQNAVDALKTEEGRIHPLVEADRKVIDSLFAVQEQRNQNAQSHERLVGFWQGVLASLVATILSAFGAMLYKRRVRPKASSVQ